MSQPRLLLHLEGAVLAAMSLALYAWHGGSWWLYIVLLLAPDLSALGYLAGTRVGATIYNLFHIYLFPATLAAYGVFASNALAIDLALIWFGHIGMDRALGFGLKYATAFKDTHLSRV